MVPAVGLGDQFKLKRLGEVADKIIIGVGRGFNIVAAKLNLYDAIAAQHPSFVRVKPDVAGYIVDHP